jgi:hypothetical protein
MYLATAEEELEENEFAKRKEMRTVAPAAVMAKLDIWSLWGMRRVEKYQYGN